MDMTVSNDKGRQRAMSPADPLCHLYLQQGMETDTVGSLIILKTL